MPPIQSNQSAGGIASTAVQAAYYDERWQCFDYANLYCLERAIFILNALSRLGLDKPHICDLGCGAGWLTEILNCFGPTVGVDLSPQATAIARQCYPKASFVCADASSDSMINPLWQSAFHVVVSQEVIEHVENKAAYLSQIRYLLVPGGCLIMTTPNAATLNAIPAAERKAIWEIQPVELPLTRGQLNRLLSDAGFRVIEQSSLILGCGKTGLHRAINSHKLNRIFQRCGASGIWDALRKRAGLGMYLTTVASKEQ
jgi:SAM-dependent methyltransferase